MSICFRTLSCKLTFLLRQRNQIVQLDRRLMEHFSSPASLQESYKTSLKKIISDEITLTVPIHKTSIEFKNIEIRLYSNAPKLSRKPIETSVEDKYSGNKPSENSDEKNKPSKEQLEYVFNTLQTDLPKLFVSTINYKIYRPDLEFINNFKGTRTKGLNEYIKQMLYLRITAHIVYSYVKLDILKITMHPEENTVKIRWRIRGLSILKVCGQIWKLKLTSLSTSLAGLETWYDGFSTFYVDSNGLVYKHVVDKMMPDDETIPVKDKTNIAAKLAA